MRKRILQPSPETPPAAKEIDIASIATVVVTSETEENPVENLFDGRPGRGGARWQASGPGEQTIVLEFDAPQSIRRVVFEVEETEAERRQEVDLSVSADGGASYREVVRQEYNFSPNGATFEREDWHVAADGVTHLRLRIRPDKGGGPWAAKATTLAIR